MSAVKTPDEIRAGLRNAKAKKETLKLKLDKVNDEIADLLAEAQAAKGLTFAEAAEEVGLKRQSAYELVDQRTTADAAGGRDSA